MRLDQLIIDCFKETNIGSVMSVPAFYTLGITGAGEMILFPFFFVFLFRLAQGAGVGRDRRTQ